mgnify:CR=1 FL=1
MSVSPHTLSALRSALGGISATQLRRDIAELRAEGVPIKTRQDYVPAAQDTQQVRRGAKVAWLGDWDQAVDYAAVLLAAWASAVAIRARARRS